MVERFFAEITRNRKPPRRLQERCPNDLAEAARVVVEIWKEHAGRLAPADVAPG
jgi:hypothetical protein